MEEVYCINNNKGECKKVEKTIERNSNTCKRQVYKTKEVLTEKRVACFIVIIIINSLVLVKFFTKKIEYKIQTKLYF